MNLQTIITDALPVAEAVATALAPEAAPAIAMGVKIAQGVAAEVPEAITLYQQFQSGTIPTEAELDAYTTAEDGAYSKLMADLSSAS